jgi:RNA polymerase sigma factor (sigma-70 family)
MKSISEQTGISGDREIIVKILDGELALFEILIRRHNAVLYKIARSYGFNHQDAEDLIQETHVAAFSGLKGFEHRSSYKTWLSKILVNKCLYQLKYGYFKNERPRSELLDESVHPLNSVRSQPANEVAKRELARLIEQSLELIPPAYRTVFVLREVEGFSVAETAELMGITPTNVKVRLNRAKAMLQKELEQFYSSAEIYELNLVFCDKIVKEVFAKIQD